jgi:hypothetical protein
MTDSTANKFVGGVIQNGSGTSAVRLVTCEVNVFESFYHETTTPETNQITVTSGTGNVFRDWWLSGVGYVVNITNSGALTVLDNLRHAAGFAVVANNTAVLSIRDTVTLTGTSAAACQQISPTRWTLPTTADLRVTAGKKIYLETTGTGSYIGRVSATAEIELGLNGVPLSLASPVTGTTAPSAGGAGALPATPAGYVQVRIAGTLRQIPYY